MLWRNQMRSNMRFISTISISLIYFNCKLFLIYIIRFQIKFFPVFFILINRLCFLNIFHCFFTDQLIDIKIFFYKLVVLKFNCIEILSPYTIIIFRKNIDNSIIILEFLNFFLFKRSFFNFFNNLFIQLFRFNIKMVTILLKSPLIKFDESM